MLTGFDAVALITANYYISRGIVKGEESSSREEDIPPAVVACARPGPCSISKTFANVRLKYMYFRVTFANVLLTERSPALQLLYPPA